MAFIEKYHNVKLYDYQKQILEWMIKGYSFSIPVRSGRKLLLDGYVKYLEQVHGKHIDYVKADKHIELKDVINNNSSLYQRYLDAKKNTKDFKQEFTCDWIGVDDNVQ